MMNAQTIRERPRRPGRAPAGEDNGEALSATTITQPRATTPQGVDEAPRNRQLGRYELMRRLAVGGMGELYLAKLRGAANFEKRFVIKKILPHLAQQPEFVSKFVDEANILVRLTHGNIVSVFDMGEADGELYMAMEYIEGSDLRMVSRRLASRAQRLDPMLCVYIAAEVCKGLSYAHQKCDDRGQPLGIVHRDISPSNILVSTDGEVKLVDFGIARATEHTAERPGQVQGKLSYMSPEQASGAPIDARADLFSLGVVLYELLTGARPFDGRSDQDTLSRVKAAAFAPAATLRPDLDPALDGLLAKVLSRDPADRPPSADALLSDLMSLLMVWGQPITASTLSAALSQDLHAEQGAPLGLSLDRVLDLEAERLLSPSSDATRTRTQSIPRGAAVVAWSTVPSPSPQAKHLDPTTAPPLDAATPPLPLDGVGIEDAPDAPTPDLATPDAPIPSASTPAVMPLAVVDAAPPGARRRSRLVWAVVAACVWLFALGLTAWWFSDRPASSPANASTIPVINDTLNITAPLAPDPRADTSPDPIAQPKPTLDPPLDASPDVSPDASPDALPDALPAHTSQVVFAVEPAEGVQVQVEQVGGASLSPVDGGEGAPRYVLTSPHSYAVVVRPESDRWQPCAFLILTAQSDAFQVQTLNAAAPCASLSHPASGGGHLLTVALISAATTSPAPVLEPKNPSIKIKPRVDTPPTKFVLQTDRRVALSIAGGKSSAPDTSHTVDVDKLAPLDVILRPPPEGSFTYLGERLKLNPASPPRQCVREAERFVCSVSFSDHATLMVNTFLGAEKINCDISIDGQSISRFNHVKVRVRPGSHTVRASRCERGPDADATVTVTAGQSLGVPFDLSRPR
jgi:serine/threonine protein kinase